MSDHLMCRWYESIDRRPGRAPLVRTTDETVSFEMAVLGGKGFFVPTPRTRLVIHCDRDGQIVAHIREGRAAAK